MVKKRMCKVLRRQSKSSDLGKEGFSEDGHLCSVLKEEVEGGAQEYGPPSGREEFCVAVHGEQEQEGRSVVLVGEKP